MSFYEEMEKSLSEDYEKGEHKKLENPRELRTIITLSHILKKLDEIITSETSEKDLKSLIALAELTDFVIDNIKREKQKQNHSSGS